MRISYKTRALLSAFCFVACISAGAYYGHYGDALPQHTQNAIAQFIGVMLAVNGVILARVWWLRILWALGAVLYNFEFFDDVLHGNYSLNLSDYTNPLFAILLFGCVMYSELKKRKR